MQLAEFKNKLGKLRVAANHRYLEYDDGTPFFYLGDTAWLLFHRLNREEAHYYLSNRAAKGFTVIQTYGHNCVWQTWTPEREPKICGHIPWYESVDSPGAFQMGFVRRLFESYPFQELVPAQDMIVDGPTSGGAKIRAMMSRDKTRAFIYSPRGEPFAIDKRVFKPRRVKEFWYDPRYGCTYYIHTTANAAFQTYAPPTSGRGNDWILILKDEQVGFR